MPELDFMVIADYVRQDGGVLQMVGAGFDTMYVPALPAARQVGVGLRLHVDVAEAQEPHIVELIYQDNDGQRLTEITGRMGPVEADQPLPPEGRPFGLPLAFNIVLPIPAYGEYSLELAVDGASKKSIALTVAPPPQPPGHA